MSCHRYKYSSMLFWSWCVLLTSFLTIVQASTPNIILSVDGIEGTWMAKRGAFGSDTDKVDGRLVHAPAYDELLCEYYRDRNYTVDPLEPKERLIMMVPRGLCTFEKKAFAAQEWYGASAILIYDNLSARYQWNNDTETMTYPKDEWDYECDNGYGFVYNIELDPPAYSRADLDPVLDMSLPTTNCSLAETREPCASQLCLVTGPSAANTSKYPVCCAWDLPTTMAPDDNAGDTSDIVAIFLTIRQGEELVEHVGKLSTVEARPSSAFNVSMIFLWLLAILITYGACRFATADYRHFQAKLARFQAKRDALEKKAGNKDDEETGNDNNDADLENLVFGMEDLDIDDDGGDDNDDGEDYERPDEEFEDEDEEADGDGHEAPVQEQPKADHRSSSKKKEREKGSLHSLPPPPRRQKDDIQETGKDKVWVLHSLPPPERKKKKRPTHKKGYKEEHTAETNVLPSDAGDSIPEPWAAPIGGFEMSHWHVLGFVVLASFMLFMLFYFQFYHAIFILYGIGCAGAVSHLIFGPLLVRIVPKFGDALVKELNKAVLCGLNGFDITSQLLGYMWAILWIWYGLSHYRPSTNAFFWITIDVFGACFCILALSMLKLNNIRIATMLLLAVFFYDIFFVFLTPLFLDGESIMITVAKGGGGDAQVDDFCYKYPEDKDCTGIDFLPMLLVVPRMNDYMNGSALLGLGDIVLPGYLIAFCARLDQGKRIIAMHTKIETDYPEKWYQGYFFWLMVAYAFGLALAFVAFGITGVGQPALLYLVPTCLGMICIVGRKELKNLWKGAKAIRLTDKLKAKCERAWGKEKMKRQVAKLKRERAERNSTTSERTGSRSTERPSGSAGRGRGGRGRGGRNSGRGRGRTGGSADSSDRRAGSTPPRSNSSDALTKRKSSNRGGSDITPVGLKDKGTPNGDTSNKTRGRSVPQKEKSSSKVSKVDEPCQANGIPQDQDICFGNQDHLGTKHLRTIVKRELQANPRVEFSPSIFKSICSRLEDRKLYVPNEGGWNEASRNEARSQISQIFDSEREKLQANSEKKKANT